jgi:hypothetical protein
MNPLLFHYSTIFKAVLITFPSLNRSKIAFALIMLILQKVSVPYDINFMLSKLIKFLPMPQPISRIIPGLNEVNLFIRISYRKKAFPIFEGNLF